MADDVVIEYRLRLDVRPTARAEYLTFVIDAVRSHEQRAQEHIATRADDLCLTRYDRVRDGELSSHLVVTGAADGRIDLIVWFDADQLHEALDELDLRWVDRDGRPEAEAVDDQLIPWLGDHGIP